MYILFGTKNKTINVFSRYENLSINFDLLDDIMNINEQVIVGINEQVVVLKII